MNHTIVCSQCKERFSSGYDYRIHWEKHLDDFMNHGIEYCKKKWQEEADAST